MTRLTVDSARIHARLRALSAFGNTPQGLYCLAYSPEEDQAHALAASYMRQAGLAVRTDSAGNTIGRREGASPDAPVVMTGSHLDTVYGGGMFDGRLGVVGAIEALHQLHAAGIQTVHPIEVCVYRGEEGCRFMGGGSGAGFMTGTDRVLSPTAADRDGIRMAEALVQCGLNPQRLAEARLPDGYAKAHVELHIEQSGVLESRDLPVGVVTGICVMLRGQFTITGRASHAGATPMDLRRDALCAAAELMLAIEAEAGACPGAVATVGRVDVHPGGPNVIPGRVDFSLDLRHMDPEARDRTLARILARAETICAARRVAHTFTPLVSDNRAKPCDAAIMTQMESACAKLGLPAFRLPSGAGHDTGSFSDLCPIGMVFVRIKDGLSHHPDEYASPDDCALGAEVLMHTLIDLAVPVSGAKTGGTA